MLFFFEAAFFALAIATLVVAELASRGLALGVWGAVTALSLAVRPLVRARMERTPPGDRLEANWRRTVADSWRHLNKLLLIGLAGMGAWWWIGTQLGG